MAIIQVDDYIRESCEKQNAVTPNDFIGMARAYEYVIWHMYADPTRHGNVIHHSDLMVLICHIRCAKWVDYRDFPATFANGNIVKETGRDIHRLLQQLLAAQDELTADEFYIAFEKIHPWDDGNGRVGSLLWNYKNSTIQNPIHPPEFKG